MPYMDTLMKANVFFFVTTIAVVVFMILGAVALVYIIKILRSIKRTADKLGVEIENASVHADALYHKIAESFLFNLLFGKKHVTRK